VLKHNVFGVISKFFEYLLLLRSFVELLLDINALLIAVYFVIT